MSSLPDWWRMLQHMGEVQGVKKPMLIFVLSLVVILFFGVLFGGMYGIYYLMSGG